MNKKTKAVEGVGDWEKEFDDIFSPVYDWRENNIEDEIKQFIKKELEKAEERVMREAVELSDQIEMDTPNTEFEEWRAFKRFRNTLRDRYELKFQKNNYEK